MKPRYKVIHTDRTTAVETELTELIELSEVDGIKTTIDTFSFRIQHKSDLPLFEEDDKIKIWLKQDETAITSSDLVMDGVITEIRYTINVDGALILVRGVNRLERLLTAQAPASFSAASAEKNSQLAIIKLIEIANSYKLIGETDITTTNVATNQSDGTTAWSSVSFPNNKHYYQGYKPIFQHIEDLSTSEWTGDGPYIFFLDENNDFHWQALESSDFQSNQDTIDENEQRVVEFNTNRSIFDVVNVMIVNCGPDKNDNSILILVSNPSSIARFGAKWKYHVDAGISEGEKRRLEGLGIFAATSNADFRTSVKERGRAAYQPKVAALGTQRYKINIVVLGSLGWNKGKIYTLNSSTVGLINKKIRLFDVEQSLDFRGWFTKLIFQEDEETVDL